MGMDLSLCTQCRCLAARRNARAIPRHFEARLRRHGLRATQFSVLTALASAGPMPMGELAELLGLERLTASGRRKVESAYLSWKAARDSVPSAIPGPSPPAAGP
jgi:hypothetical protein